MNVYEQLISEWLSIQGYVVVNNVKVGRNALGKSEHNASGGGWAGELDVVGWNPVTGDLVNYEPSIDSNAWPKREERYARKVSVAKRHIAEVPQLAGVLAISSKISGCGVEPLQKGMPDRMKWLDGELITHDALMDDIECWLRDHYDVAARGAIPETHPLLRTLQLALLGSYRRRYRSDVRTHNGVTKSIAFSERQMLYGESRYKDLRGRAASLLKTGAKR